MENNNFTEVIDVKQITEDVLEYMDLMGFSTEIPVDPESIRNSIDSLIRDRLNDQGVRTHSFGNEYYE